MKHITTMSGNCMTRALSITLILGLLLSSLAFSPNLSEIFGTNAQAVGDGYWTDDIDTSWYDNYRDIKGTEDNPYSIGTAKELAGLAYLVNRGIDGVPVDFAGKFIQLMDDIDLGGHEWVPIGLANIKDENENIKDVFKGTFDGQGYTISNMHLGTSDFPVDYIYAGLFGYVRADRNATNITIANVNIDDNSWVYASTGNSYAGGICAYAYADATLTISNCSNSANITAEYRAGGICAYAYAYAHNGTLTISNCSNSGQINRGCYVGGICGEASSSTKIDNCSNSGNVSVSPTSALSYSGGICGEASRSTIINNCINSGNVSVSPTSTISRSGGICGEASRSTKIDNCINSGNVSVSTTSTLSYSGGICGEASSSTKIDNCSNSGNVSTTSGYSGGICSYASRLTKIDNCINSGNVSVSPTSTTSYSGGICGEASRSTIINNCINSGKVSTTSGNSGGICGYALESTINNCSNSGKVSTTSGNSGGICGYASEPTINNCSNSGEASTTSGNSGEICGSSDNNLTISNCYYKKGTENRGIGKKGNQIKPEDQPGETTALPESQMSAWRKGLPTDNSWVDITINGESKGKISLVDALNTGVDILTQNGIEATYWEQKGWVNNKYPYLNNSWLARNKAGNDVYGDYIYIDTPQWYKEDKRPANYTINTAEELAGLAKLVNIDGIDFSGVTITLGDNIDLSDHCWEPIGIMGTTFKGTFDGKNKTINGVHVSSLMEYDYAGLFGIVNGATIKDVNITGSYIYGSLCAGGICAYAYNNSTISGCSNSGNIFSNSNDQAGPQAGGICGRADTGSEISDCTNSGSVSATSTSNYIISYAGGICGKIKKESLIKYGSIAAENSTKITNCVNSGNVTANSIKFVSYTGGICAWAGDGSEVNCCSNNGNVIANSGERSYAGGICAIIHNSTLISCTNSGKVSSNGLSNRTYKGSYVGEICGSASDNSTISNCYYEEGAAIRGIGKKGDQINPEDQPGKTTALPESQMTAAAGTTNGQGWVDITINGDSKGKIALVDALGAI